MYGTSFVAKAVGYAETGHLVQGYIAHTSAVGNGEGVYRNERHLERSFEVNGE